MAVGLVLLRHAWPDLFPGAGIVGVTIFFTLSGYLITGIIRREVEQTGGFSYRRFYRNRALRLLPALVAVLAVFAVVELATNLAGQAQRVWSTIAIGLLYLADVPRLPIADNMSHLWTLAVEEQFYLVWPTALLLAIRRGRVRRLLIWGGSLWLVSCLALLAVVPEGPLHLYQLPTTWVITMLAGAALNLYRDRLPAAGPWAATAAGLALGGMCFLPEAKEQAATYLVGAPLTGLASAVLISFAIRRAAVSGGLVPLRWLGLISYAAYLWNFPVLSWLVASMDNDPWAALLSLPATVAMATLSWFAIERPALAWKRRLDHRHQHTALVGRSAAVDGPPVPSSEHEPRLGLPAG
ncbi:hypothetical protein GCM10023328_24090 [Modestobacter marinus]|uniref:Acyltransferase 3 domain-containing protein n=1 Tax=Modestobacter marinus TaxID=477641 RepID=A0ABQ2FX03_9ACTN|nr:hypothetical protein GCM10011589_18790 [Modestobacter marinus]